MAAVAAQESPAATMLNSYRTATRAARRSIWEEAVARKSIVVSLVPPTESPDANAGVTDRRASTHRSARQPSDVTARSGGSTGRPDAAQLALPLAAIALNNVADDITPGEYWIAVKILSFPEDQTERAIISDVLPEVAIMEEITRTFVSPQTAGITTAEPALPDGTSVAAFGSPAALLLDYGVTAGGIWLVMEKCAKSLRSWRLEVFGGRTALTKQESRCLFDLFQCVLFRLHQLHMLGITHYDIKCDNVLLRPGFDAAVERYHATPSMDNQWLLLLPYVCWTDFGESVYVPGVPAKEQPMVQGRGTECIKPPELLVASNKTASNAADADIPSAEKCDVWSVGCLLYELMTGNFLFSTDDWAQFYVMVCGDKTTADGATDPATTCVQLAVEQRNGLEECMGPHFTAAAASVLHTCLQRNSNTRSDLATLRTLVTQELRKVAASTVS